jgi:nitrite reductase/ring-hydroxylating ferredoxin subunit
MSEKAKTNRRAILKALATVPLAMSFGPALNYFRKQQEREEIALKLISVPPQSSSSADASFSSSTSLSSSSATTPSPSSAAYASPSHSSFVKGKSVKLDSKIFEATHVPQPFTVELGDGKTVKGFGVKLSDGRIVAYPAHCPTRKLPIALKHGHDLNDKSTPALFCNDSIFDLNSGAALKGPDKGELRPFKVKNCGQKVCVIIEDKYLSDFTS